MNRKTRSLLTSAVLCCGITVSGTVIAGPDLPDPPKPKLPDARDLPGMDKDAEWWDPLGLFNDGDKKRHPHGHKPPGHKKHKGKHKK